MSLIVTKEIIEKHWPLSGVSIEVMHRQGNGGVVGVVQVTEGTYTYKIPGPWKSATALRRDLSAYDFLHRSRFQHISRLLKTKDGSDFIEEDGQLIYLYEYVEGETPPPTPHTYTQLAKVLAELHAVTGFPFESDYRPEDAIPELIQGAGAYSFNDEYISVLKSIPSFTHLPLVPIHTELTPQNCIRTAGGEIVALDWDEVGLGPAVLDLGVGLINHFVTEDLEIKNENAEAYYQAYFSLRPMVESEKEFIYHAGLFWACAWVGYGDTQKRWERITWAVAHKERICDLFR